MTTASGSPQPQPQVRRGRLGLDPEAAAARTEELFAAHGRAVSGLCRGLLRDRAEAEDAAQQTFLAAHRALLNGGVPREPAAWIATIARNECLRRITARMREPLPSELVERAQSASDPPAEAIRRAEIAALWSAIEALPRAQRDALLLRELGGMSYDELAVALSVSGPAVESLLFRARRGLRSRLRAAYAAFTGASWLEAAARALAGGGVPVAGKLAAVGVGAATLAGGAAVAPQVLDNHHPRGPAKTRTVRVPAARPSAVPPPVPVRADVAERRRGDVSREGTSRRAGRDGGDDRSGPGGGREETTTTALADDGGRDGRDGGEHSGPGGGGESGGGGSRGPG